jgi:hypothetical protein
MAKITIGGRYDNSTTKLDAELSHNSQMELIVGDSFDMSKLEISIIERYSDQVLSEVNRLRNLGSQLNREHPAQEVAPVQKEVEAIAETATRVVEDRKWYDISAKGLIEAAKAVGEVSSPLISTALKIIELLQKAKI